MKTSVTQAGAVCSRRHWLGQSAALAAALSSEELAPLLAGPRRFKIGACDWSIGKTADPSGLELARRIGLDGLQVSLGTAQDETKTARPEAQRRYREAARETGMAISSMAIGELNNIPYKSDPRTEAWVQDGIRACHAFGCRVILLAFFYHDDLRGDPAGTREVIRRLKKVAPQAEQLGVILGVESWLSARDSAKILDAVGSPAVKVYYDVCNSTDMGYDIFEEIRWLGRERICEFHLKENGHLLGRGKIDFRKVRQAMDAIRYAGWMQIEGAVPPGQPMFESYVANRKFLRSIFTA